MGTMELQRRWSHSCDFCGDILVNTEQGIPHNWGLITISKEEGDFAFGSDHWTKLTCETCFAKATGFMELMETKTDA